MNETETEPTAIKPVRRRKATRARRSGPPVAPKPPGPKAIFNGITQSKCCDGCTPERCLISTIAICKHPMKTSDSGCGPVTMANRAAAKKVIKHEQIDAA